MYDLSVNTKPHVTTLKIKSDIPTGYRAVILDIEGNFQQEYYLGGLEENIDIMELPEKIYILQIFNMNKQMITYKMFQKSKYQSVYNTIRY